MIEIFTPATKGGSWSEITPPGITGPLTEIHTPATKGGSWITLEQRKRAHRHIGMVRGARG